MEVIVTTVLHIRPRVRPVPKITLLGIVVVVLLQTECLSSDPTNSIKALKVADSHYNYYCNNYNYKTTTTTTITTTTTTIATATTFYFCMT